MLTHRHARARSPADESGLTLDCPCSEWVISAWALGRASVWRVQLPRTRSIALLLVGIAIALIGPIPLLDAQRYAAYATGLQALGVLVALILAGMALSSDRHDKQVDRVLLLHSELVGGETQAARIRLVEHLRRWGGSQRVRSVTRGELQATPGLSAYQDDSTSTPLQDSNNVLRFFERANAAVKWSSGYEPLFHQLIIRHALWWEVALQEDSAPWAGREALSELTAWGRAYEARRPGLAYLASWQANRERDFGENPASISEG